MTNKDFIKLLLISIGCDKQYEINSHRTDDNSTYYEVTGKGDNENQCIYFDGFGIYDLILNFLNYIRENPDINLLNNLNYSVIDLYQKYLLDDNERNKIYDQHKKNEEVIQKYLEDTKYITDWCKENHPCPNCTKNKKDHWDDIHFNCTEHHNMRCPILKEYFNDRDQLYQEYRMNKNNKN